MVATALRRLQAQAFDLDLTQLTNDADDGDPVAGMPAGLSGVPTYLERRQSLREAQERVCTTHADVLPQVRDLLAQEG